MIKKLNLKIVRSCSFSASIGRVNLARSHSAAVNTQEQNFINGRRCVPKNHKSCEIVNNINPATGKIIGRFYNSDETELNRAVENAKEAFESWSSMTASYRSQFFTRTGRLIEHRIHDIAKLETMDTGKTLMESTYDVEAAVEACNFFAAMCHNLHGSHIPINENALVYTRREPLGVCAGIGAWNFPINNIAWKTLPALACGNTYVYKPSPLTPLTSTVFAEIFSEAGLPPGVLNVVQGGGNIGQLMCTHEDIAKVSFTGSIETGGKVMAACAPQIKNITLELGGKSPMIVFEDADMDNAVQGALMANYITQGEVCSNASRIYVQESLYEEFVAKVVAATKRLRIGDTMDGRSQIGALISEDHLAKVQGFLERAVLEGGRILCGGSKPNFPENHKNANGYFLTPCVMDNCSNAMEIVRDEHFGPIMCVMPFSTEEEVIKRANNTKTGLAGGVFTRDISRAHRVVAKLQAGSCCINTYNMYPVQVPFGGFKMSGIGHENGFAVLRHYTQEKTVYVELNDVQSIFQ